MLAKKNKNINTINLKIDEPKLVSVILQELDIRKIRKYFYISQKLYFSRKYWMLG